MKAKFSRYYFVFFLLLNFLYVSHLLLIQTESRLFYIIEAVAQVSLTTLIFSLITHCITHWVSEKMARLFVLFTFIPLLASFFEFPFLRLMDVNVWYWMVVLTDETLANFIEMLKATNIPLTIWGLIGLGTLAVFLVGIWLLRLLERWENRKPLYYSLRPALYTTGSILLLLVGWDTLWVRNLNYFDHYQAEKSLPWKTSLMSPKATTLSCEGHLKSPHLTDKMWKKLQQCTPTAQKNPDIFLFIIESLREDYLDEVTAPNLAAFKQQNEIDHLSFSNGNATQLSWFSIFYSQYPFYWGNAPKEWKNRGAPSLHLLKKMGYDLHVYSSSRLSFYQMKDFLFGSLLTSCEEVLPDKNRAVWQCDQQVMKKVEKSAKTKSDKGRLFVVFLESTHFDYSWPQDDLHTPFKPSGESIDFIQSSLFTPQLELIQNRYRNAIHYVDQLIGNFLQEINKKDSAEPVIVITGDHGEEFFEEGRLFHASNINEIQTRVPIYYNLKGLKGKVTSHMDIFPTLLNHLNGEEHFCEFFEGHSLFKEKTSPYIVSGRYNACRSPQEFFVHTGKTRLLAQFCDPSSVLQCQKLRLLSLEHEGAAQPIHEVPPEMASALSDLFAH